MQGTYGLVVSNSTGSASASAHLTMATPSRFEAVSFQADGWIDFMLSGDTGGLFQIELSEGLVTWQRLVILTNTDGPVGNRFLYGFFCALRNCRRPGDPGDVRAKTALSAKDARRIVVQFIAEPN